jgi:hypothetical protein
MAKNDLVRGIVGKLGASGDDRDGPLPRPLIGHEPELLGHPLRHTVAFCFAGGHPSGVASSDHVDIRPSL